MEEALEKVGGEYAKELVWIEDEVQQDDQKNLPLESI